MPLACSPEQSATGGLSDWRGWLGLGLALGSCVSTVIYFVSLQAFRRMGFTSMQLQAGLGWVGLEGPERARRVPCQPGVCCLPGRRQRLCPAWPGHPHLSFCPSSCVPLLPLQYCYLIFSILLLLPLTLPVDGTDWTAQFATWRVAGAPWARPPWPCALLLLATML